MTKKHFIALADALKARLSEIQDRYKQSPLYGSVAHREFTADIAAIADVCAASNPAFDRARWLGYIAGDNGPNGGKL